jgi:hypothetical protein
VETAQALKGQENVFCAKNTQALTWRKQIQQEIQ